MRARSLLTLSIGLLLAGAAVHYVDPELSRRGPLQATAAKPALPLATVVVARRDLARGDLLRADALQEVAWPVESLPEGTFTSIESVIGDGSEERRARHSIVPGEPVLAAKVAGLSSRDVVGEIPSPGKRAVSIRVHNVSGEAGVLLPGDRVDILLTRQIAGGGKTNPATNVILQDVVVLAIDAHADGRRERRRAAPTATVEVAMEDAPKLAHAMQVGDLSLAPRNAAAHRPAATDRSEVARPIRADAAREREPVVVRSDHVASN
jgi:pilus assembly protein CpaB